MGRGPEFIRSGSQHRSVCTHCYNINVFDTQELCYSLNSSFGVGYGSGGVGGLAYRDTVVIGDATGHRQFIGAANKTGGFTLVEPIDGICTSHFSFFQF